MNQTSKRFSLKSIIFVIVPVCFFMFINKKCSIVTDYEKAKFENDVITMIYLTSNYESRLMSCDIDDDNQITGVCMDIEDDLCKIIDSWGGYKSEKYKRRFKREYIKSLLEHLKLILARDYILGDLHNMNSIYKKHKFIDLLR